MDFWGFEGREEMVGGRFGLLMADPPPASGGAAKVDVSSLPHNQARDTWEKNFEIANQKLAESVQGEAKFLKQFNENKEPKNPTEFDKAIDKARKPVEELRDPKVNKDFGDLQWKIKNEYSPRHQDIQAARKAYEKGDYTEASDLLAKTGFFPKKGGDATKTTGSPTQTTSAPQPQAAQTGGKPTVNTQSTPEKAPAPDKNTQPPPAQQPPPPSAGQQYINTMNTAAAATAATIAPLATALGGANVVRSQVQGLSGFPGGTAASYGYNTGGFGFGASAGPYGTSVGFGGGVGGYDPSGTGFNIGVESDESRERARRTEIEIQQLLAAIMSGNMDAIASALILMTFKAKQTMLKAAALVVRAMQLYDKQMEGQNEKMKALAGKGFNPEIGQQFEVARQEMNLISTQRQSISNNLRDIMSMVEEIGNNEKGYLDKKFQIQSSQSRWV